MINHWRCPDPMCGEQMGVYLKEAHEKKCSKVRSEREWGSVWAGVKAIHNPFMSSPMVEFYLSVDGEYYATHYHTQKSLGRIYTNRSVMYEAIFGDLIDKVELQMAKDR